MNQVSIGSDNGLPPIWRQAIIWTNAGLLSMGPLGTNFSEILIKIQNFSFTKMHLKIMSSKRQPFCPGGDELTKASMKTHSNSNWQQISQPRNIGLYSLLISNTNYCTGWGVSFRFATKRYHENIFGQLTKHTDNRAANPVSFQSVFLGFKICILLPKSVLTWCQLVFIWEIG